jgi:TolB protein
MSVSPAWSPDGREIIFANDKEGGQIGNFEIFKIDLEAAGPEKRLTFRRRAEAFPSFSLDGKQIIFASNTDGNSEIYLMNSDGTGLLRVTRNPAEDTTPQFSKGGTKIVFSSNRSGKFTLYEIEFSD